MISHNPERGGPVNYANKNRLLLIVLFLANGLMLAPSIGYVPLIPQIKEALGLSYSQIGLFSGIAGLAGIACALPAGATIARFGYRKPLLGGMLVAAIGLLALAASRDFPTSLASRGLWQAGVRFALPAAITGVALCTSARFRSTVMAMLTAVGMLLTVLTMNISSVMAEHHGWRTSIVFFAAIMLVASVFALFLPTSGEVKSATADEAVDDQSMVSAHSAYRQPWMWAICLMVLLAGEEGLIDNFASLQMHALWGFTPTDFAKLSSIGLMLAVVVNLGIGLAADRVGRWPLVIGVCGVSLLASIAILLGQYASSPTFYALGLIVSKSLQLSVPILVNSMAPAFLGRSQAGQIIALAALGSSLGQFVGPQTLGWMRDFTGAYTAGWVFMSLNCAVTLTIAKILRAHFPYAGDVI